MYTDITTVEAAFAAQKDKIDYSKLPTEIPGIPARLFKGMMDTLVAEVVVEAINNDDPNVPDFDPDYNNSKQNKYGLWAVGGDKTGSGFSVGDTYDAWTLTAALGGARLAFRDRARALHFKKYFPHVLKAVLLKLEG